MVKAFRLLAHLAQSGEPVALTDLSRALDLPKATGHRLALMLERIGFVQKDPLSLRYSVGAAFEAVALSGLRNGGSGTRRFLMDALAGRLGVRTNFVVLKAGKLLFVEWVESTSALRVDLDRDAKVPVHCSASGKLLMAFGPDELRQRFLKSAPYKALTASTITSAKDMERELAAIRQSGWSEDDEQYLPGVCCLAVPIRNALGEVVAGLAVMAPKASFPLAKARRHLPQIRACAERISAELGWRGPAVRPPHAASMRRVREPRRGSARNQHP